MAEETELDRLRQRLYEAYATGHSGISDSSSQAPGFDRDIRPHLPRDPQAEVLDLGCGQGHYVRRLLDLGFERTRGIDVSPEQVEKAHAAGLDQVSLGDFQSALGTDELDVVIATDFLEHLTRFEALHALDRIKRSLHPGGVLILRVPNAASPFGGTLRYGDLTHETSFTPGSLRQLAAAAAFSGVETHACNPPVHGVMSGARAAVWWAVSAGIRLVLMAETGQVRGHVVTQNLVAVMRAGTRDPAPD